MKPVASSVVRVQLQLLRRVKKLFVLSTPRFVFPKNVRKTCLLAALFIFQVLAIAAVAVFTYSFRPRSRGSKIYVYENELATTLIIRFPDDTDECVKTFLGLYERFCEAALVPREGGYLPSRANADEDTVASAITRNTTETNWSKPDQRRIDLCPCVPRNGLVGRRVPTVLKELISASADFNVVPGGHWSPVDCVSRQRIAIIIPFKDRKNHLQALLRVLHPMLQRQLVEYTIFVIEQDQPKNIFNKAALMNAGFVEARDLGVRSSTPDGETVVRPFDCFIFHDVDMLPEDDRNFYGCASRLPRHVGAYVNKWDYNLHYSYIFGGATSFRPEVFELVNGYSNEFYGWGGEDDDMLNRIEAKDMTFIRFPKCVATYTMIPHERDKKNPPNNARDDAWESKSDHYLQDGLNNLRYQRIDFQRRANYTWLLISLPSPPPQWSAVTTS